MIPRCQRVRTDRGSRVRRMDRNVPNPSWVRVMEVWAFHAFDVWNESAMRNEVRFESRRERYLFGDFFKVLQRRPVRCFGLTNRFLYIFNSKFLLLKGRDFRSDSSVVLRFYLQFLFSSSFDVEIRSRKIERSVFWGENFSYFDFVIARFNERESERRCCSYSW